MTRSMILAALAVTTLAATAQAASPCDGFGPASGTRRLTPDECRILEAVEPSMRKSDASARELYTIEAQMDGPRAVAECRSRPYQNRSQYDWCLEAQRGRR